MELLEEKKRRERLKKIKELQKLENDIGYILYNHWIQRYWTSRGKKLDFIKYKYLTTIYEDQFEEIVWKKAAQKGITERMISEALWLPDQFKENSIYFFPTSGTVSDLVQERIDEPINNNKYLSQVSGRAKKLMGKQADKVGMKRMSRGFVYFRGTNNPTQITSVSADAIFVDELDRMEPENVAYLTKRLENSKRRWKRWTSTPTIPNLGIDAKYSETDQREYHVKCNHCNQWLNLDFWNNIDIENKRIICNKCDKIIIPWQLEGQWIRANKSSDIHGYYVSPFYSQNLNLNDLIKASQKTTEWEVMQFYNQNLGLAYEPKGAKITEEDILAATKDYTIPRKTEDAGFIGIDVGKILHVVIIGKQKLLFAGEFKNFEEVHQLMNEYNVKSGVVDGMPETRESQKFADVFKGKIYLCWYSGVKEPKEGEWFKHESQKVNTDRTNSLDVTVNEIKKQLFEFPKNLNSVTDYKVMMKNLIRVVKEDGKGGKKAEYIKIGADHYFHATNYAVLAKHIFSKKPIFDSMLI